MNKKSSILQRSGLSQAIAFALLTGVLAPATSMAGTGSCAAGGLVTISDDALQTCVLNEGDSVIITEEGLINMDDQVVPAQLSFGIRSERGLSVGDITNAGTIDVSDTGIWVYTYHPDGSGTAGNITNSGVIRSDDAWGIYVYGNAGNIINSGTISSNFDGIYIYQSTQIGDITNSGYIYADGAGGIYVSADDSAPLNMGAILNSGTIISDNGIGIGGEAGATVNLQSITNTGTIEADDYGIYVYAPENVNIAGDVMNSGLIDAGSSAIRFHNVDIGGSVINTGTIISDDFGMYIYGGTVAGDVINSGTMLNDNGDEASMFVFTDVAGNVINEGILSSDGNESSYGMYVYANVGGNIENKGLIDVSEDGIYVFNFDNEDDSLVSGDIINSGTIMSGDDGIYLYSADVAGSIINSGVIESDETGIMVGRGSAVGGDIINSGTIISDGVGLYVYGDVDDGISAVVGDITNSGTIETDGGASILVYNDSNQAIGGNVFNSGKAEGYFYVEGADFTNSGLIDTNNDDSWVEKNFTQTATGELRIDATDDGDYGYLVVDGTATFASGSKISVEVQEDEDLNDGEVLLDVVEAAELIGADSLKVNDNKLAFAFSAVKDGNTIDLNVMETGLTTISNAVAETGSPGANIAGMLDAAMFLEPDSDLAFGFGSLNTAEEVAQGVETVLPALAGGVAQASLNVGSGVAGAINARQQGISSGDEANDQAMWLKLVSNTTEQSERDSVSGYDLDTSGFVIGADRDLSSSWNVGSALAILSGEVESDLSVGAQEIQLDTIIAKVYATYTVDDRTNLDLQVGMGRSDNDSKRTIVGGAVANSDYDSELLLASAKLARNFKLGEKTTYAPYVKGDFSQANVESYEESGAGSLNLEVDSGDADSLIVSVGVDGARKLSDSFQLTANLGLGNDTSTDRSTLTSNFEGSAVQFTTEGMEPDATVYNLGVGAKYTLTNGTEISATYDLDGRDDYSSENLSMKARWMY